MNMEIADLLDADRANITVGNGLFSDLSALKNGFTLGRRQRLQR